MMDLAQEKERLQSLDEYGVKTTRQWNVYYAEWERQHPRLAVLRRCGSIAMWTVLGIVAWLPLLIPLVQLFWH